MVKVAPRSSSSAIRPPTSGPRQRVASPPAPLCRSTGLLPVATLSLIFLTGVIFVATRYGLWPSLYAATLSFFAYNFLFTDPRLTFHMARQDDVLTLALFYVASILTGNLAAPAPPARGGAARDRRSAPTRSTTSAARWRAPQPSMTWSGRRSAM